MSMSQRSGMTNPLSNKPFDNNTAQNALATLMGGGVDGQNSPGRENVLGPGRGGIDFSREETDMRSMEGEIAAMPQEDAQEMGKKKKKKKKDKEKKEKKQKKRDKSGIRIGGEMYDE